MQWTEYLRKLGLLVLVHWNRGGGGGGAQYGQIIFCRFSLPPFLLKFDLALMRCLYILILSFQIPGFLITTRLHRTREISQMNWSL